MTREVATITRSAGSRWKVVGNEAISAAIAAVIGSSRTVRGCAAAFSQSVKGILNDSRPRSRSVATSHRLMSQSAQAQPLVVPQFVHL